MKSLDAILVDKLSARELLKMIDSHKENRSEIKLHPNGFLQLQLTPGAWRDFGLRFHVWADDVPVNHDPRYQIHDHCFDIDSYVLCGELINTMFDVEPDENGNGILVQTKLGELVNTQKRVLYGIRDIERIKEGTMYTLVNNEFHTSHTESFAATVISKYNVVRNKIPMAVLPLGYNPDALVTSRDFDQKLAWEIIDYAQQTIRSKYN